MASCCCVPDESKADRPFEKGSDKDPSQGPLADRGCTDPICLLLWFAHLGLFFVVTFAGMADGNPQKLFLPRDYQGAYCGVQEQWNEGPNLETADKLWFTMNTSSVVSDVAKATMCSDTVEQFLQTKYSAVELSDYRCTCCKVPCKGCSGSLTGRASLGGGTFDTVIQSRMSELTQAGTADMNLFSADGANGDLFSSIWDQAALYFVKTCSSTCDVTKAEKSREYIYIPDLDDPLRGTWDFLLADTGTPDTIKTVMTDSFKFQAYSSAVCPYHESKCVAFPGVEFTEMTSGYCQFKIAADVANAIGDVASSAFAGLGLGSVAEGATGTFGSWIGEVEAAVDTLIVVAFLAFGVGFVFCILVRFFIGIVMWLSICLLFCLLMLAGGMIFVRSGQCKDTGFFESGQTTLVAVQSTGENTAANVAAGGQPALTVEEISGDGASYRGFQQKTRTGQLCMKWEDVADSVFNSGNLNADDYTRLGLTSNFCRNPIDPKIPYEATTIWCYTTETRGAWQTCIPLGVLQPECENGYEVESETMRDALLYLSYIIWACAGIYLLAVWCLSSRIALAIAVNKVAAMFMYETPSILLLPVVESFIAIGYTLCWMFTATFLISQVPATYTPTEAYLTYAEAYGTVDVPGKCNDKWPTGSVWRDPLNCDTTGDEPKCWRCYPPRYILDTRFAFSFFSFLWNNAFLIAAGQCIIAGAVGIWFFKPHGEKRMAAKVSGSIRNTFRYHLGSIAFGSLLVAIVQFIRYFMMYLEKQAKAQKNHVMVIILKAAQCCLWCLEKCIKFLNANAYIQVAIMGTNFCTSAKAALQLIMRNILRFGVVTSVSWVVEYIGFCFITLVTTIVGYLLLKAMHPTATPIMPVIMFIAIGYIVGKLFMALFHMAVSTSLQCFIMVEEMGGEPGGDASFVPGPLRGIVKEAKEPPPNAA